MKFLVVYFSRGGKTRKVAEAITQELGCKAVDIEKEIPDISGVDLLLVGSGTYGGMPHKKLLEFLNGLQPINGGKAAIFTTSAGPNPKSIGIMKGVLEVKGYKVVSNFECRGQILSLNQGHPTEEDLKAAKVFAGDLKKKVGA